MNKIFTLCFLIASCGQAVGPSIPQAIKNDDIITIVRGNKVKAQFLTGETEPQTFVAQDLGVSVTFGTEALINCVKIKVELSFLEVSNFDLNVDVRGAAISIDAPESSDKNIYQPISVHLSPSNYSAIQDNKKLTIIYSATSVHGQTYYSAISKKNILFKDKIISFKASAFGIYQLAEYK